MEEENKELEQVKEEVEKLKKLSPKQAFAIRLSLWAVFAAILPCAFIIWRFELFTPSGASNFGFWGLVVLVIIFVFLITILKYVTQGLPYSMLSQCLIGFARIIPLLILFACVCVLKDSMDNFTQALGCVITSECIAVPLNPLPKWAHEHNADYQKSMIDIVLDKYYDRKQKEEDK